MIQMSIRIDESLKQQADDLFRRLGLNTSAAITAYLTKAVRLQKIPFESSAFPFCSEIDQDFAEQSKSALEQMLQTPWDVAHIQDCQLGDFTPCLMAEGGKWKDTPVKSVKMDGRVFCLRSETGHWEICEFKDCVQTDQILRRKSPNSPLQTLPFFHVKGGSFIAYKESEHLPWKIEIFRKVKLNYLVRCRESEKDDWKLMRFGAVKGRYLINCFVPSDSSWHPADFGIVPYDKSDILRLNPRTKAWESFNFGDCNFEYYIVRFSQRDGDWSYVQFGDCFPGDIVIVKDTNNTVK